MRRIHWMRRISIFIAADGEITCDSSVTRMLNLDGESKTIIRRRASHVEPDSLTLRIIFHLIRKIFGEDGRLGNFTRRWRCIWRVDMSPSGGPILEERYLNRGLALDAERRWLWENTEKWF
jgi:hypothetical protein